VCSDQGADVGADFEMAYPAIAWPLVATQVRIVVALV
jgi:hypothetical protein